MSLFALLLWKENGRVPWRPLSAVMASREAICAKCSHFFVCDLKSSGSAIKLPDLQLIYFSLTEIHSDSMSFSTSSMDLDPTIASLIFDDPNSLKSVHRSE